MLFIGQRHIIRGGPSGHGPLSLYLWWFLSWWMSFTGPRQQRSISLWPMEQIYGYPLLFSFFVHSIVEKCIFRPTTQYRLNINDCICVWHLHRAVTWNKLTNPLTVSCTIQVNVHSVTGTTGLTKMPHRKRTCRSLQNELLLEHPLLAFRLVLELMRCDQELWTLVFPHFGVFAEFGEVLKSPWMIENVWLALLI